MKRVASDRYNHNPNNDLDEEYDDDYDQQEESKDGHDAMKNQAPVATSNNASAAEMEREAEPAASDKQDEAEEEEENYYYEQEYYEETPEGDGEQQELPAPVNQKTKSLYGDQENSYGHNQNANYAILKQSADS